MTHPALSEAIRSVPAGAWAVGVSGGADSIALLVLLHQRPDLALHVTHLDHETRGPESTADADFVRDLAGQLGIPCTVALRSEVERALSDLPANLSSRFRAARISLFRRVVTDSRLAGVVLAHHGDDQAETVLHRLLRGSGPMGLGGIATATDLGGLRIVRPLLGVRREDLRRFLAERGQAWREDASNASAKYFRNRLRRLLAGREEVIHDLHVLGDACGELREWVRSTAPVLAAEFAVGDLADCPSLLAAESARRWLVERGIPAEEISPAAIERLIAMAADAGKPSSGQFHAGLIVKRARGVMAASWPRRR